MEPKEIILGQKFASEEEIKNAVKAYEKKNGITLKPRSTKLLNAIKHAKYNPAIKYAEYSLVCQYWIRTAQRSSPGQPDCPFHMNLYPSKCKNYLTISKLDLTHDHHDQVPANRKSKAVKSSDGTNEKSTTNEIEPRDLISAKRPQDEDILNISAAKKPCKNDDFVGARGSTDAMISVDDVGNFSDHTTKATFQMTVWSDLQKTKSPSKNKSGPISPTSSLGTSELSELIYPKALDGDSNTKSDGTPTSVDGAGDSFDPDGPKASDNDLNPKNGGVPTSLDGTCNTGDDLKTEVPEAFDDDSNAKNGGTCPSVGLVFASNNI